MNSKKAALYASAGPALTHYDLDVESYSLIKRGTVILPNNVQYAWQHSSKPFLYVASSSRTSRTSLGTDHQLSVLKIEVASGELAPHGDSIPLPHRPIHLTTDIPSENLLVAFNSPSCIQVFRINADATLGESVPQREAIDTGIFPHQVRVTQDNRLAILVTRGNPSHDGKPHEERQKDPGALKVFAYKSGLLGSEVSIAPHGGYGFGPRHIDFHPTGPWVYVSLETQNKLYVFKRERDTLAPEPLFMKEILATPDDVPMRQGAGTVHVHPNGRFVYCVNRGHTPEEIDGKQVLIGADNTFAAYSINPASGEPTLIQHQDSHGICARTFALDPSGRMLVAANSETHWVKEGSNIRSVSANLAVFEIRTDGSLGFVRKYDVELGGLAKLFWMGIVTY